MAGVVIDTATGLPRVVPIRQRDGVLRFAYEVRHQGGMAKLMDVPPEAITGSRVDQSDESDLQGKLRESAKLLAAQLLGDGEPDVQETDAAYAALEERVAAAEAQAEEARTQAVAAVELVGQAEDAVSEKDVALADLSERLAAAEARAEAAEKAADRTAEKKPARPRAKAAA